MCAEGVRKRTGQHEEPRTGGAGLGVEGIVCGGGVAGSDFMLGAAEWPANSVLQIIRCSWGMPHVVMTTVQPRRESRGAPPQLPESWVTWGSLALRHAALAFEGPGRRSLCIGPRLCCGRDCSWKSWHPMHCNVRNERRGRVLLLALSTLPPRAR